MCLDAGNPPVVTMWTCTASDSKQFWVFDDHVLVVLQDTMDTGTPLCLAASNLSYKRKDPDILRRCKVGDSLETWVIDHGHLELKDTMNTAIPTCLDADSPPRADGNRIIVWKCETPNSNQLWVVDGGQVKLLS